MSENTTPEIDDFVNFCIRVIRTPEYELFYPFEVIELAERLTDVITSTVGFEILSIPDFLHPVDTAKEIFSLFREYFSLQQFPLETYNIKRAREALSMKNRMLEEEDTLMVPQLLRAITRLGKEEEWILSNVDLANDLLRQLSLDYGMFDEQLRFVDTMLRLHHDRKLRITVAPGYVGHEVIEEEACDKIEQFEYAVLHDQYLERLWDLQFACGVMASVIDAEHRIYAREIRVELNVCGSSIGVDFHDVPGEPDPLIRDVTILLRALREYDYPRWLPMYEYFEDGYDGYYATAIECTMPRVYHYNYIVEWNRYKLRLITKEVETMQFMDATQYVPNPKFDVAKRDGRMCLIERVREPVLMKKVDDLHGRFICWNGSYDKFIFSPYIYYGSYHDNERYFSYFYEFRKKGLYRSILPVSYYLRREESVIGRWDKAIMGRPSQRTYRRTYEAPVLGRSISSVLAWNPIKVFFATKMSYQIYLRIFSYLPKKTRKAARKRLMFVKVKTPVSVAVRLRKDGDRDGYVNVLVKPTVETRVYKLLEDQAIPLRFSWDLDVEDWVDTITNEVELPDFSFIDRPHIFFEIDPQLDHSNHIREGDLFRD